MKNEFVIRTKRPAQYFRGEIYKGYSPEACSQVYFIVCLACSGGRRKDDPIQIHDWYDKSKTKLINRLKAFAKRGKYIFSFNQKYF